MRCCDCANSYSPYLKEFKRIPPHYICKCRAFNKSWWTMNFQKERTCRRFVSHVKFSFHDAMGWG